MKAILPFALLLLAASCSQPVSLTLSRPTEYTGRGNTNEILLTAEASNPNARIGRVRSVTICLHRSADNVSAVRILCGDRVLGEAVTDSGNDTLVVECRGAVPGCSSLAVAADIRPDAPEGSTVSADIIELSAGGACMKPEAPEPGAREVLLRCKCLYRPGEGGSGFWRIPAMLQLSDGTLLAVNDKRNLTEEDLPGEIDVVRRYSTDGGETWSEMAYIAQNGGFIHGYGDPGLAELEDGTVVCTFTSGENFTRSCVENPQRSFFAVSKDFGRTWSEPQEFTSTVWGPESANPYLNTFTSSFTASGNSLVLHSGPHKGRLLVANACSRGGGWGDLSTFAIRTDDGGASWNVSGPAALGCGDESKMVELKDGRILMSIRHAGQRLHTYSNDWGETWEEPTPWDDVTGCACNGDMIRYNDDVLLHSVPVSDGLRENICILLSFDEGQSWTKGRSICPGPGQYSSITVLKDGTVGVFFEKNTNGVELWYENVSLDWIQGRI